VTDSATLLRALAVPRLVGSEAHAAVRELLKGELTARGLTVEEQRFGATDAPLRRAAFAAELTALAALAFMVGALAGDPVQGARVAAVPLIALVGVLFFGGRPAHRAWGTNVLGRPDGAPPQLWLTAHYDSKGQRMSMALRLCGLALLVLQAPAVIVLGAAWGAGQRGPWLAVLALPALAGGVLLARADLRNDSPGAVDNASGVLAALETFDRLPRNLAVGVAFTDAEEWGLQGARALMRERPEMFRHASVINFDGLDDHGVTVVLVHRSGPLATRIAGVARARRAYWLPVLVDGMALARVSQDCVTVMRGGWDTMRRVHTPRDEPNRLALEGVRGVATAVADALRSA